MLYNLSIVLLVKNKPVQNEESAPRLKDERIVLPTLTEQTHIDKETAKKICAGVIEPKKIAYLLALAQLGNRSRAAKAVGISAMLPWCWRRDDDAFREAYVRAMEMAAELQEDEMLRRAAEGVVEPVFQGGRMVGSIRRFSDTLLIFGLKGSMPEKYSERQKVEHSGAVDIVGRLNAGRERALARKKE